MKNEIYLIEFFDKMKDTKEQYVYLSEYVKLQEEIVKLRNIIQETINVIGDGDNGPPRFYNDIFDKLENALREKEDI